MFDFDEEQFLDECKFAKVVRTYDGDALLIGGHVIKVRGEMTAFAELIATALRRNNFEDSATSSKSSSAVVGGHI